MIKVFIQGDIAEEVKVNTTKTGKKVTNINVSEETRGFTTRHKVVCWEKLAEKAGTLPTGTPVYIECERVQYRSYEGNDGQKRWVTEFVASSLEALGDAAGEISGEPLEPIPGF